MHTSPLIITLLLDKNSFAFFDALRKKYFPPAVNYLSAHLTLFHHLPPNEPRIIKDLQNWRKARLPLALQVTEVKSIGKGVAYQISSPALSLLHKNMQEKWQLWLTPQDKQKMWPHVTVQNKVTATEARETLQILQASFQPFTAMGEGFGLWSYEGGPWKLVENFFFKTV